MEIEAILEDWRTGDWKRETDTMTHFRLPSATNSIRQYIHSKDFTQSIQNKRLTKSFVFNMIRQD
jgi:hypothetical protein